MIQKLRQILLTQYIGAIVIAIVAAHCVEPFIRLILSIIWHWVILWRIPAGAFSEPPSRDFDWAAAVYSFVDVLLNGAVAYGLMRWLYFGHEASAVPEVAEPKPPLPQATEHNS